MSYKIDMVDNLPADVEEKMIAGFKEYEKNHGIDVNYNYFSITITDKVDGVIGVLNVFTAFAEIYIDDIWVDKKRVWQKTHSELRKSF